MFFDIDGTLLLWGVGRRVLSRTFREHFGPRDAFDGISFAGRTDPALLDEALSGENLSPSPARRESFFRSYYQKLRLQPTDDLAIMPGAHELLRVLHARPLRTGVITGNNHPGAQIKLEAAGLAPFFHGGGFGEDGPERTRVVNRAIERFRAPSGRTVVIGDSPADVRTGKEHGLITIAVSTGSTPRDRLARENPDLLLEKLTPLERMLQFLGERNILP